MVNVTPIDFIFRRRFFYDIFIFRRTTCIFSCLGRNCAISSKYRFSA